MSAVNRIRARLATTSGYTLVEMVTVMAILTIVLGSLTAVFVSGSRAELDMNRRFQAQQDARMALTKIRREIHCAQRVDAITASSVTLFLPDHCKTGTGQITWCTAPHPAGGLRWGLHRAAGPATGCNATVQRWADHLITGNAFAYTAPSTATLAKVSVSFTVDFDPSNARGVYRLTDSIAMRNSTRAAP